MTEEKVQAGTQLVLEVVHPSDAFVVTSIEFDSEPVGDWYLGGFSCGPTTIYDCDFTQTGTTVVVDLPARFPVQPYAASLHLEMDPWVSGCDAGYCLPFRHYMTLEL